MDTNKLTQEEREGLVRDALDNLHEVYRDCAQRQAAAHKALADAERDTGIPRDQIDPSYKP